MISTVLPPFPGGQPVAIMRAGLRRTRNPRFGQPQSGPSRPRPTSVGGRRPTAPTGWPPRPPATASADPAVRHRWPSCCSNVIRASHDAGTGRIGALEPRAGGGSGLRGLGPTRPLSHRHRQQPPPHTTAGGAGRAGGQRRGCCSQVVVATWLLQPRRWADGVTKESGQQRGGGRGGSQPGVPAREGAGAASQPGVPAREGAGRLRSLGCLLGRVAGCPAGCHCRERLWRS